MPGAASDHDRPVGVARHQLRRRACSRSSIPLPTIADKPGALPLNPDRGRAAASEHVDFSYVEGKPILHDISFTVRSGQTLGIVGPPGSGKSTIANLVPRFYDVSGGRITIDVVDIRDVTLASLREYVGLVQQEAFLFDSTVTNNVAYADPWAEEERIVGATKTAQLHEYIAALPGGYGTRVGERGVALSGGQRQRMSIARGVVPGPGIMIFDDSTAAIDAVTEKRVRDALAEATRAKATIIIAHRLSSLMHADEILVLEEGRIVERGTHEELIAQRRRVLRPLPAADAHRTGALHRRRAHPSPQGGGGRRMSDFAFDRMPGAGGGDMGGGPAVARTPASAALRPKRSSWRWTRGWFAASPIPQAAPVVPGGWLSVAAILSAIAQLVQPLMFGQAISVATSPPARPVARSTRPRSSCLRRDQPDPDRHRGLRRVRRCRSSSSPAMSIVSQWMSTRLAQKVIFDLRRAMFEHFQAIALSFMDRTHVGRIMSRLQGDVNALQDFLESTTSSIGDLLMLVGIVAVLLIIDWKLGLLTLLVLPALIAIRAVYLPYNKKAFRAARDASAIANGALAENISGVRTVQETRREAMNFELYEEKARATMATQITSAALAALMSPTVSILTGVAMAIIIVVGGSEVIGQTLALGVMIAYVGYVQKFFEPVRMLSMQYTALQRLQRPPPTACSSARRAVDADRQAERGRPGQGNPAIEFEHVINFGYDPARPVLKDARSTENEPSRWWRMVGPTGSGKTSIISLVQRFYEVNRGRHPHRRA